MGISIWQLLIILAIVLLLFGAKRLRNIGTDLGEAVKGFRKSVKDPDSAEEQEQIEKSESESQVIEGEATKEKDKT